MSNEPIETIQEPPRTPGETARKVAAEIQSQRDQAASEAAWAASEEEPAFNVRTGESNFGKRLAAKIHLANQ